MADIKISDLTAAASASGAQQLEVNDSGTSRRITVDQIKAYAVSAGSIDSTALGTDSVTTIKIINGAVTTAKIADGAVTAAKLASPIGGAINESQGSDIASASTLNLTNATGNYVRVTGTTGITAITLAQGAERTVVFAGILTITNGASLILPGGNNITTAAGDVATFRGEASGVVRCTSYLGSGVGGAVAGGAIYENNKTITSSYTITSGKNAVSVGDITLASGVTVTVPSGSRWVIL